MCVPTHATEAPGTPAAREQGRCLDESTVEYTLPGYTYLQRCGIGGPSERAGDKDGGASEPVQQVCVATPEGGAWCADRSDATPCTPEQTPPTIVVDGTVGRVRCLAVDARRTLRVFEECDFDTEIDPSGRQTLRLDCDESADECDPARTPPSCAASYRVLCDARERHYRLELCEQGCENGACVAP